MLIKRLQHNNEFPDADISHKIRTAFWEILFKKWICVFLYKKKNFHLKISNRFEAKESVYQDMTSKTSLYSRGEKIRPIQIKSECMVNSKHDPSHQCIILHCLDQVTNTPEKNWIPRAVRQGFSGPLLYPPHIQIPTTQDCSSWLEQCCRNENKMQPKLFKIFVPAFPSASRNLSQLIPLTLTLFSMVVAMSRLVLFIAALNNFALVFLNEALTKLAYTI